MLIFKQLSSNFLKSWKHYKATADDLEKRFNLWQNIKLKKPRRFKERTSVNVLVFLCIISISQD